MLLPKNVETQTDQVRRNKCLLKLTPILKLTGKAVPNVSILKVFKL